MSDGDGLRDRIESLVIREYGWLMRWVLARAANEADAQDVVQDTLIGFTYAVDREPEILESPGRARAVLRGIARHKILDRYHSGRIGPLEFDPEDDEARDPATGLERRDFCDKLMNGLTKTERYVVQARIWDGLSYSEIAERLGTTEVNARAIMSRAIRKMRGNLGEAGP